MHRRRRAAAVVLVLVLLVLVAGCSRTTGSGRLVTREVDTAGGFDRIQVSSGFQVDVTMGERDAVTVEVDDNLADRLDVGVAGGTLRLSLKPGPKGVQDATLRATVTARRLHSLEGTGSSAVTVSGELPGPELDVGLSGASSLDAAVRLEAAELDASGASELRLRGSAGTVSATASGASDLVIDQLQARRAAVELSGASQARVWATESISATASGASQLRFKGSPRFERRSASGGSSIEPS
jgi:Putative auto-transporter adhesin, head GIN domain